MRLLTHKSCGYQSFEDHRFVSRAAWCPCQDASPFTYVDTHAGRGVYDLIVEEVARCDAHADALPPWTSQGCVVQMLQFQSNHKNAHQETVKRQLAKGILNYRKGRLMRNNAAILCSILGGKDAKSKLVVLNLPGPASRWKIFYNIVAKEIMPTFVIQILSSQLPRN